MKYQHACLKCEQQYQDNDPDRYLCLSCRDKKKEIAKQIDATFVPRPQAKTALQEYEEAEKGPGGFMRIRSL